MPTYLVTGGAGFIGSNYIRYMLKKYNDIEIINLDKLTYAGNLDSLKEIEKDPRYKFIEGQASVSENSSKYNNSPQTGVQTELISS